MCGALRGASEERATATTKLLVELLLEGLAQQVKGKGVEAGVGEGQDTSYNTAHKVNQGSVHLAWGGKWFMEKNRGVCLQCEYIIQI